MVILVKKNAFTLMELLAVILILTIMGIVVIPIVENSINSGKDDLYIAQIDSIKASLKKYAIIEINNKIRNTNDDVYVSLYHLKINNYVSLDIKDPRDERLLPNDMLLRIQKREKNYIYEVLETTGTKTDETKFNASTPVLEVPPIVYFCGSSVSEFNEIADNYKINTGNVVKEYYDANFTKKVELNDLLVSNNSFRVLYKANGAYQIMNVLRSGCE